MSIKWMDKLFEGPFSLSYWEPPNKPALFAIMLKPDPQKAPLSYRILYFGKSSSLKDMKFYQKHKKLNCWEKYSQSLGNLYIGFLEMSESSNEQREELLNKFIDRYKPVCNF